MRTESPLPAGPGPDDSHERAAMAAGARFVAGVDEAGRGPLAGPVVVAAVILDPRNIPLGLNDSKKLGVARREALYEEIVATGCVSVVLAPPRAILRHNILGATLRAMREAVEGLGIAPDLVLVDGRDVPPGLDGLGRALIGGDGRSVSIAAASIVAKVTRDRLCAVMENDAPGFGFARHKGYGSKAHMAALETLGPCRHHRAGFAPVARAAALRDAP